MTFRVFMRSEETWENICTDKANFRDPPEAFEIVNSGPTGLRKSRRMRTSFLVSSHFHACGTRERIVSCQDGAVQRSSPVEDMQQVVNRAARTAPRRSCPNTELRQWGLASTDLVVPSAVAAAGGAAPGGRDAEAARSGGQRREPEDRRTGLRSVVRRGPLRRTPMEGD